jgi:hypothetical protein
MAAFPTTVATDSDLYIAVNAVSTQLTDNPLSNSATTVNVTSTASFPTVGFISIDNEIIKYTGKTGTSFTGCTRGSDGTSATSHVQNSQVFHNVIAAHHNAAKDEIIAIETLLNTRLGTSGAAYSTAKALQTNSSTGIIEVSAITNTELNYLSGVTSAIQTQLNAKAVDSLVAHLAGSETFSGQKTFSAAIFAADGTVSLPGYSFSADSDTGIFRAGANQINIATNGVERIGITTGDVNISTSSNLNSLNIRTEDGSAASPSHTFSADTNTGIFRVGADDLGFTTGGTQRLHINTAALTAALPLAMGSNKITGLANATATGDALHFGQLLKIKQIVVGNTSTFTSTTSTTRTDTGLSATITPTSTNSKVLVIVAQSFYRIGNGTTLVNLDRGGTNIVDVMGLFENDTATTIGSACSIVYQDSPATTSATTYKTQFRNRTGAATNGANGDGTATTQNYIYLIEIEP